MALQSLLLCPEEKTARVLSRVLAELEIGMEQCTEPFDAVKKLMRQRYDAVIVDWENEANATLVLKNARMSPANKMSLAVAIVEGQTSVRNAFRAGANFVLYKPISLEQAKTSLRAARALMQRGAEAAARGQGGEAAESGPALVPPQDFAKPAQSSSSATSAPRLASVTPISTPSQPFGSPTMSASDISRGQAGTATAPAKEAQGTAALEDLRNLAGNALDSFQSGSATAKATTAVEPRVSETSKSIVKPFPGSAAKSDEDGEFYKLDLDADPSSPAAVAKSATKVPEVRIPVKAPAEVQRAATPPVAPEKPKAVEPEVTAIAEPLGKRAVSTFDEVRNRFAAQPRSVPSAFDVPETEEKTGGFPKPVLFGVAAVVVVAVIIIALLHFRSTPTSHAVAQQQQPAATTPQQAVAAEPTPTPVTVEPVPQLPPVKAEFKNGKENLSKPSAGKTASANTAPAQAEVKPAPAAADQNDVEPEVQVRKLTATPKSKPQPEVAEAAPPSLDALGSAPDRDAAAVGGIVGSPVAVPKLVAPDRVRVSQGVSQGNLAQMVKPVYPANARTMHIQGSVLLEALIGKDGSVKSLKVIKGHPVLAKAATDAVKQWRYKPYLLNGQPVDVETQITVNFTQ
jgi:periplasmic protein TonB